VPSCCLIADLIVVGQPRRTKNRVIEVWNYNQVRGFTDRRQKRADVLSVPCTELSGDFVANAKRCNEDQPLYASVLHRGEDVLGLLVQIVAGQVGLDHILTNDGRIEHLLIEHISFDQTTGPTW
jgi:hypothetical protein